MVLRGHEYRVAFWVSDSGRYNYHQSNKVLSLTFVKTPDPNINILLDSAGRDQALEITYDELYT